MPCPISLTRKRIVTVGLVLLALYIVNTYFLLNKLDLTETKLSLAGNAKSKREDTCELSDALIRDALTRVTSSSCKAELIGAYCHGVETNVTVDNGCPDFVPSEYATRIGCFNDSALPLLRGYHYVYSNTNTPDVCLQSCFRAGFEVAGLKASTHCYCGSKGDIAKQAPLGLESCSSTSCPGNRNESCGGIRTTMVYATGLTSVNRTLPKFSMAPENIADRQRVKILFVLQLNGRNTRQVIRMLRAIYSENHLYIVHVDSRQKFMYGEMKKLENTFKKRKITNFVVLDRRFPTIWGGTSLLAMFLDVIRYSLKSIRFSDWEYVLNMSESDMPLLPLEYLEHNLAMNRGKSFLASHGYNTALFLRKQGFSFAFHQCNDRMWRIKTRFSFPNNMRIDGGSDWVVVHRNLAMTAISDQIITKQVLDYFNTVLLPLEGFFHTLALNSLHCHDILYKNLRLTNWRRKQGCRCASLKAVVDWCGCSPLAFREIDSRLEMESLQSKSHFFARKFDSFVAVEPVAHAERLSLKFRPSVLDQIQKSPVINSTWVNLFDAIVDYDNHKRGLYDGISNTIYRRWVAGQSFERCGFDRLSEVYALKEHPTDRPEALLTVLDGCGNQFEFRVRTKNQSEIYPDPLMEDFQIIDAEFGTNLDLKEELFRDVLPAVDLSGKATVLLHWLRNDSFPASNFSSPLTNIQWWNSMGRMVKNELVKPYDSVFGGQYAELDLSKLSLSSDLIPGLWCARMPSKGTEKPVFETHFPVFPTDRNTPLFEKLVTTSFLLLDACSVDRVSARLRLCEELSWSSRFPDPKSAFFP